MILADSFLFWWYLWFWIEGDGGIIECLWEYSFFFNLLKEFKEDGHQPLWRTVWRYLRNLYIDLPYDPAIPLLGIYLDKTLLKRDTCTRMFIAALFTNNPNVHRQMIGFGRCGIYTQWNTTQP